jgi:hypothetical protein
MIPVVDETLQRLARTEFRSDPIGGPMYSRATSIMSSAYKRHGLLLGRSLLEALRDAPHLTVWREDAYRLSADSLKAVKLDPRPHLSPGPGLEYGEGTDVIPIDVIVYDRRDQRLRSYNVKRGNGSYDGGKRRSMLEEMARTTLTLQSYGETHGFKVHEAEAMIVFYYGVKSVTGPQSLCREDLNEHVEVDVVTPIEHVNDYYRSKLHELVSRD